MSTAETAVAPVDYRTDPSQYKHWKLSFNGPVATLGIDIAKNVFQLRSAYGTLPRKEFGNSKTAFIRKHASFHPFPGTAKGLTKQVGQQGNNGPMQTRKV